MDNLIGIDIGGTKCAVALGESLEQGGIRIICRKEFPTEVSKGPDHSIGRICGTVGEVLESNGCMPQDVTGIGISCGGPLDSGRGVIMSPPNLTGWDNIPIKDILEQRFGIKTRLQNDANACALAEWRFGAARGFSNVIFLTFGTGMGAGLILDGKLYSGTTGMAGEIGHVRMAEMGPVGYGKAGSFEGFCSGGGIAQLARSMALERLQAGEKVSFCTDIGGLGEINAKVVAEAALAGDGLAREVYRVCGSYLGRGLAVLIDILNPEIIVLGSIFVRSRELLYDAAVEAIKREALSYSSNACRIVPAGLGESLGDYAALSVALCE